MTPAPLQISAQIIVLSPQVGPALASGGDGNLSWTWTGTNPAQWVLANTNDGQFDTQDGRGRSFDGVQHPGQAYYIYGVDATGARVTGDSNTVLA